VGGSEVDEAAGDSKKPLALSTNVWRYDPCVRICLRWRTTPLAGNVRTGSPVYAFEWLDLAYADRNTSLIEARVDFLQNSLHKDLQFAACLRNSICRMETLFQ
jgi:hypothetical protein